jgi:hypothetical protein
MEIVTTFRLDNNTYNSLRGGEDEERQTKESHVIAI